MRNKLPWKWEELDSSNFRAKVRGGWIVKSKQMWSTKGYGSESMVFIADQHHEWEIVAPQPMIDSEKPDKCL